jgi:hypothetical protein
MLYVIPVPAGASTVIVPAFVAANVGCKVAAAVGAAGRCWVEIIVT